MNKISNLGLVFKISREKDQSLTEISSDYESLPSIINKIISLYANRNGIQDLKLGSKCISKNKYGKGQTLSNSQLLKKKNKRKIFQVEVESLTASYTRKSSPQTSPLQGRTESKVSCDIDNLYSIDSQIIVTQRPEAPM